MTVFEAVADLFQRQSRLGGQRAAKHSGGKQQSSHAALSWRAVLKGPVNTR